MARYGFIRIIIGLLFCLPAVLSAQESNVTGKVADSGSRLPLAGAVVKIGKISGTTNYEGVFLLKGVPDIPYVIEVSFIGYEKSFMRISYSTQLKDLVIYLSPSENLLNQTVVSAGRYEQSLKKMMVSTDVIKPYLIRNKNTTNMDRFLDNIPSVHVTDGQVNIRSGSGWTYGIGSRVMILVDDMPFLTGDAGQVKWNFIPIENVQQVEVIKGASSVVYGSSALSGIVHFRTEMAGNKPITRFQIFSGIFSTPNRESLKWSDKPLMQHGASAFHSFSFKEHKFSFSGNYFKDDGYRMGESDQRFRLSSNMLFKLKHRATLGINLGFLNSEGSSFLLWENRTKGYTALDSQYTTTKSVNFYADPSYSFHTGKVKHQLRGRWLRIKNDISGQTPGQNQDNASDFLYSEYQVLHYFEPLRITVTGGLVASYCETHSPLYQGYQKSNNRAAFIQADNALTKRITLSAGARIEHFSINGKGESKPVFRAGINYEASKATFLRASVGQGYRFPAIAERYVKTTVGVINIFPNPDLKAETGWSSELGVKQGFKVGSFRGYADLAWFVMQFDNMIEFNFGVWKPITGDIFNSIGFKSLNVGQTKISGLDFSLAGEGNIGRIKLQFLGGYTYTQPIIVNPDKVFATDSMGISYTFRNTRSDSTNVLKYRYKHLIRFDMQAVRGRLMVGISVKYNSYMQNIDNAFVSLIPGIQDERRAMRNGNWITDARVGWNFTDKFKLSLVVSNLFNVEVMTRPADIRPPRLTQLEFRYSL